MKKDKTIYYENVAIVLMYTWPWYYAPLHNCIYMYITMNTSQERIIIIVWEEGERVASRFSVPAEFVHIYSTHRQTEFYT